MEVANPLYAELQMLLPKLPNGLYVAMDLAEMLGYDFQNTKLTKVDSTDFTIPPTIIGHEKFNGIKLVYGSRRSNSLTKDKYDVLFESLPSPSIYLEYDIRNHSVFVSWKPSSSEWDYAQSFRLNANSPSPNCLIRLTGLQLLDDYSTVPESYYDVLEYTFRHAESLRENDRANNSQSTLREKSFFDSILDHPYLNHDEEIELSTKIQSGDQSAKDKLVKCNLKLVMSIAVKFQSPSLPVDDLFQEGVIGLIHAADKFDPKKGFRFSTYATWWIKRSICRALINNGKLIRLPVYIHDKMVEMKRAAVANGLVASTRESLIYGAQTMREPVANVLRWYSMTLPMLDIDEVEGREAQLGMKHIWNSGANCDHVQQLLNRENIVDIINRTKLSQREKQVIHLRFGLGDGHDRTLEEVGNIIGVTRERIRQIELRACRKLSVTFGPLNSFEPTLPTTGNNLKYPVATESYDSKIETNSVKISTPKPDERICKSSVLTEVTNTSLIQAQQIEHPEQYSLSLVETNLPNSVDDDSNSAININTRNDALLEIEAFDVQLPFEDENISTSDVSNSDDPNKNDSELMINIKPIETYPTEDLYSAVGAKIQEPEHRALQRRLAWANASRLDIVEPCLFVPGAYELLRALDRKIKVRLLVGFDSFEHHPNIVASYYPRPDAINKFLLQQQYAGRTKHEERHVAFMESLSRSLSFMKQTSIDETLLRTLIKAIENNLISIKFNHKGRMDQGMWLSYENDMAKVAQISRYGFSFDEFETELGIILDVDQASFGAVQDYFSKKWEKASDITSKIYKNLLNSWATTRATPYEIYLLIMYHLVQDRLVNTGLETDTSWQTGFPPLAEFQTVAVNQAHTILRDHNGVIIADVVGLGKTYIGAALLKQLSNQGQRATVFCPPSLVPMWSDFNSVFGLNAEIVSLGKIVGVNPVNLNEPKFQTRDRTIVLIDESHRLKNSNSETYRNVSAYSNGRKCILLTATPYGTKSRDVYSQIKLFADDDIDLSLTPPRLNDFFKAVENGNASLSDVLKPLMIRRTRSHIKRYYANLSLPGSDGKEGCNFSFPERQKPIVVEYDVEGVYGVGLYDNIVSKLGQPTSQAFGSERCLSYARYGLFNYVYDNYKYMEPYAKLKSSGKSVMGFVRILLFKRLESSVHSFRITVEYLLNTHRAFLNTLKQGYMPAGDESLKLLGEIDYNDDDNITEAFSRIEQRYDFACFDSNRLINDVAHDITILSEIYEAISQIDSSMDAKLFELETLLTNDLRGKKALVFSQYESTVHYLYENLKKLGNCDWISSKSRVSNNSFMEKIAAFSPRSNPAFVNSNTPETRVLFATDVLSEGLNLQDCSCIINYDLHWNPVRLIQRVGRVDRIGSTADTIRTFNFLPEKNVEKYLHLEERLRKRIADIHKFIGEDNAILHPDEQINDEEMYKCYTQEITDDEESMLADVDYTEIEEMIRQIARENPELYEKIVNLPCGIRSSKVGQKLKGSVSLLSRGQVKELVFMKPNGTSDTMPLGALLSELTCGPSELTMDLATFHYNCVPKQISEFEKALESRRQELNYGFRMPVAQRYVIRHLSDIIKSADQSNRVAYAKLKRAFESELSAAINRELVKIRNTGLVGNQLLTELKKLYSDFSLDQKRDKIFDENEPILAQVLCSESLI